MHSERYFDIFWKCVKIGYHHVIECVKTEMIELIDNYDITIYCKLISIINTYKQHCLLLVPGNNFWPTPHLTLVERSMSCIHVQSIHWPHWCQWINWNLDFRPLGSCIRLAWFCWICLSIGIAHVRIIKKFMHYHFS